MKKTIQKLAVHSDNLLGDMYVDCLPQILVVSDNLKGLISNADIHCQLFIPAKQGQST